MITDEFPEWLSRDLREVDPAEIEADIDAFMAASEDERRADRLACGIVDSTAVEESRHP